MNPLEQRIFDTMTEHASCEVTIDIETDTDEQDRYLAHYSCGVVVPRVTGAWLADQEHVAQKIAEALGAQEKTHERVRGGTYERGPGCTCGHPGSGCYCPNSNWVGPLVVGTGVREVQTIVTVPTLSSDWTPVEETQ